MKKLLLSFLFPILSFHILFAQEDCNFENKALKEEAIARAEGLVGKLNKFGNPKYPDNPKKNGQGYIPNEIYGSALEMSQRIICYDKATFEYKGKSEEKYILESMSAIGKSKHLAQLKAKADTRKFLIQNLNLGNLTQNENLDIDKDFKFRVLACFFKQEENSSVSCLVTIALDKEALLQNLDEKN